MLRLNTFTVFRSYSTAGYTGSSSFVKSMINDAVKLCKPANVHVCDGSEAEAEKFVQKLLDAGTIEKIPQRPNSYLARSDPKDVARVEKQTYICSKNKEDAGPTNNWIEPAEMKAELHKLFDGCMKNRTMYVIPFSMGPLGSDKSKLGIEITDSPYVCLSMKTMTRIGDPAMKLIEKVNGEGVVPCMHTLGAPLADGQTDVAWPCNETKRIVHFPEELSIWSYGSGYGGNALLGKKCMALRIASIMAKKEGWLAEHMLVLALTSPEGKKYHIAAAFPSACGKTNLAMLKPSLKGWKVETVGDDIAWMKFGEDGRLRAINPEAGFFGVAPGTSAETNPAALESVAQNTIFTNVAKTDDGDVWWEGMTKKAPDHLIDWKGNDWTPASGTPAAHPNARFCVGVKECPVAAADWEDPEGVPIDAILFGGRRATTVPLVTESFDWNHGVFMGASVASEQTAAAEGVVGSLRHDPFAMLPFMGYNMADYFQHWLNVGEAHKNDVLPKLFQVNWFRKGDDGKFLWPGFGDNSRVLKWVCDRLTDKDNKLAVKSAVGLHPSEGALDLSDLSISPQAMEELFRIDAKAWERDLDDTGKYFEQFGSKYPATLKKELEDQKARLKD